MKRREFLKGGGMATKGSDNVLYISHYDGLKTICRLIASFAPPEAFIQSLFPA